MSIVLEDATTDQLLEELFNRSTFAGVILFSPEAHKFHGQPHKDIRLLTTCDDISVIHLLQNGIATMEQRISQG